MYTVNGYNILCRWSGAFKKVIQKPRIPIYLGGFSPNTFSSIAKYADEWLEAKRILLQI